MREWLKAVNILATQNTRLKIFRAFIPNKSINRKVYLHRKQAEHCWVQLQVNACRMILRHGGGGRVVWVSKLVFYAQSTGTVISGREWCGYWKGGCWGWGGPCSMSIPCKMGSLTFFNRWLMIQSANGPDFGKLTRVKKSKARLGTVLTQGHS